MDGYPTQCPSISMMDGETQRPNAHYWALWLISHNFGPGDQLVTTTSSSEDVVAQASITSSGRKILLINTTDGDVTVNLAGAYASGAVRVQVVDAKTGENAPRTESVTGQKVTLGAFAVAVAAQGK
jgi:hypothetical protein